MRKAMEDRRQPVIRGVVEAVEGRTVRVALPDGRVVPAAPVALAGGGRGMYHRYAVGDDVLLFCDQGDPNGAACLSQPRTAAQDAPAEVDNAGLYIYEDVVEVRAAEGDDVQGVVMRPVLDGLHAAYGAISDLLDVMASPSTPPGSAAQNAALLTAVRTQIGLPAVGTSAVLANVLNDLDTSRLGQGTGPYCSDVLRAVVDGPQGGGGGGGVGSPSATLEDIDDAIQAHLAAAHADLATDADIAALDARVDALESAGPGAVTSVNGQTGVVVLDYTGVGADASGAAAAAVAAHDADSGAHTGLFALAGHNHTGVYDPAGTASGLLATHVAAGDPHTVYVLEAREGAANGIATLNGSSLVPRAQLGTGSSGFLTYGGTWSALVAGDIPDLSATYAAASHTHAASAITSGTLDVARIPDLSSLYQPLDTDLTAVAGLATTGFAERTGAGTWAARALVAGDLPSHTHTAGDLSGGTLDEDRLPIHALLGAECGYGSDGDLDFDGAATVTVRGNAMAPSSSVYTLACDLHANDLVIGNGVTIRLNGFVIRCHTLTIAASATVVIADDGTSSTGTSGAGDFSNTSTTDRDNGPGATGRNTAGIGATASNLSSPAIGGAGGAGGSAGSAGGSGGTVAWTTANQNATGWPMDPHSLISLRTITNVPWKCGAGGGAGAVGAAGGVSGGGGAGGGLAIVCAGAVTLGASASLTIAARGGDGGPASGAAAGGGGGGGGGCVVFTRRRQTLGAGATVTLTAAGGNGGAGSGTGNTGSAGSAGRTFNLTT